jgi:hypothetical protein
VESDNIPKISDTTRQQSQERNHERMARLPTSGPLWTRRNNQESHPTVPLARSKTLDSRIHAGMCHVSTKQKYYSSSTNATIPDPIRNIGTPLLSRGYGSNHGVAKKQRVRCHSHYSRSRGYVWHYLSALSYDNNGTPNCQTISQTRVSMVRSSTKDNQQSRSPFHFPLWMSPSKRIGHPTESINSLSPSNQWIIRTKESMGRTIPPPYRG